MKRIFGILLIIVMAALFVCPVYADQNLNADIMKLQKYKGNAAAATTEEGSTRNDEYIKKYGEEKVDLLVRIARGYITTLYNTNFMLIKKDSYIKSAKYYYMPESGQSWYFWTENKWYDVNGSIKKQYDEVKKYKVSRKTQFVTDGSLVYSAVTGDRVRGRFKVYFDTADSKYLAEIEKRMIVWTYGKDGWKAKKNTSRNLKTKQWYYADIEIDLGDLFSKNPQLWEHTPYTFCELTYLTEWRDLK